LRLVAALDAERKAVNGSGTADKRRVREEATMAATHSDQKPGVSSTEVIPESVLEEEIDVALHPDRAHHDELGRTVEPAEHNAPSPREQPAGPIDIGKVEE
jgi:hypothetical protein